MAMSRMGQLLENIVKRYRRDPVHFLNNQKKTLIPGKRRPLPSTGIHVRFVTSRSALLRNRPLNDAAFDRLTVNNSLIFFVCSFVITRVQVSIQINFQVSYSLLVVAARDSELR